MFWKNPICLFTVRFMLRLNNMMVLGIKEESMTKTLFSNYESWKTGAGSRLNHSEKTHWSMGLQFSRISKVNLNMTKSRSIFLYFQSVSYRINLSGTGRVWLRCQKQLTVTMDIKQRYFQFSAFSFSLLCIYFCACLCVLVQGYLHMNKNTSYIGWLYYLISLSPDFLFPDSLPFRYLSPQIQSF